MYSTLSYFAHTACLTFEAGDEVHVRALARTGYEPNGYFWESIAQYLTPSLADDIEWDSESSTFFAYGPYEDLETVRTALEPYLQHPELLPKLIEEAVQAGAEIE